MKWRGLLEAVARCAEQHEVRHAFPQRDIRQQCALDEQSTHAVRHDGDGSVGIDWWHIGDRLDETAERHNRGVRAPDAGHVECEAGRVADAEHVPVCQRGLCHQEFREAAPRTTGVAAEAVNEHYGCVRLVRAMQNQLWVVGHEVPLAICAGVVKVAS